MTKSERWIINFNRHFSIFFFSWNKITETVSRWQFCISFPMIISSEAANNKGVNYSFIREQKQIYIQTIMDKFERGFCRHRKTLRFKSWKVYIQNDCIDLIWFDSFLSLWIVQIGNQCFKTKSSCYNLFHREVIGNRSVINMKL